MEGIFEIVMIIPFSKYVIFATSADDKFRETCSEVRTIIREILLKCLAKAEAGTFTISLAP
jgi:hypothetical protein